MTTESEPIAADKGHHRFVRVPRTFVVGAVALVVIIGFCFRLYILFRQPINSDEAVVGLMAHEILHGHFFAFYWGQDYGGGEPYVVALSFFLFGQSSFTLGLVPVLLDTVCAFLVYRIGRRMFNESIGIGSALVFYIWPEAYVWQSTLEYGFRWLALTCCLVVLLVALRICDPRTRRSRMRHDWITLGFFTGLGWWCSPEIVYYLVPVGAYFVYVMTTRTLRVRMGDLGLGVLAAILGAGPWIWANIRSHLASFHHGAQPAVSFLGRLRIERAHVLPIALGIQLRSSGHWLFGANAGRVLEYALVGAGIVFLVVLVSRRIALPLVAFLVTFPFLYAYSPFTWFWQDARYGIYLAPMLALTVIAGISEIVSLVRRNSGEVARFIGIGVVVVICLSLTLESASKLGPYRSDTNAAARVSLTSLRSDPNNAIATLATSLEHDDLRDVFAGYWVSYVLAFEARGGIVSSDARTAYARYTPYLLDVERANRQAWLFVRPTRLRQAATAIGATLLDPGCAVRGDRCLTADQFEAYLKSSRIGYSTVTVGAFNAVIPDRAVMPRPVLERYRIGS